MWSRVLGAAVAALVVVSAFAQKEFELRNDRLVDGGSVSIQAGFIAGEIGGAVFNTSSGNFPLKVTKVRIFWQSLSGGQPDTLADSIIFYQGGGENPPSPVQVTALDGPVLHDGYLNEFDMTPYNIQFDHGPFSVGLKFLQAPDTTNGPSLVTDVFGCEAGKNLIYSVSGLFPGWSNGCVYGISGDFVIRVVCVYAGVTTNLGGQVNLGLWSGNTANLPMTLIVEDGANVLETLTTTLDASGNYSVVSHQTGTHDIVAKVGHWLSEKQTAVSMGGSVTLNWHLPRNGDVTNDNRVVLTDLSSVLRDFNKTTTNWSDLDGSGTVNLLDLSIVLANFNQQGAQ